jgi:hypothetical protein
MLGQGATRRDALKFLAAGAFATAAGVATRPLAAAAQATSSGGLGDYDYIVTLSAGTIEAYDNAGNLIVSGGDWGSIVNALLSQASDTGIWIHTTEGVYPQSTNVAIPAGYNSTVKLTGEGMSRTPQAKYTSPRPSTIIKNISPGGRVIDTPNLGQPAVYIRDIVFYNSGGGACEAINLGNALEGEIARVMVTQVDPTKPFLAEPSRPGSGSIGINLSTSTGKNLFRLQQVYIINYDTGLLINSDWVCADQLEFNWCNTRCVDIEGGFYQEFRFLHAFDCGGTMVYDNKAADTAFERELTTIIGLADEGKPPAGYASKAPSVNNAKGAFMLILGTFNPAGTGVGLVSGVLTNTYGLLTDLPSAGGGSLLPGPVGINAAIKTLSGSTAGTVMFSMPFAGLAYKKFLAYLNGYQNSTGTPQTIAFPVKFTQAPALATDVTKGSSASTTSLALPPSMAAPVTGWVIVEGF